MRDRPYAKIGIKITNLFLLLVFSIHCGFFGCTGRRASSSKPGRSVEQIQKLFEAHPELFKPNIH